MIKSLEVIESTAKAISTRAQEYGTSAIARDMRSYADRLLLETGHFMEKYAQLMGETATSIQTAQGQATAARQELADIQASRAYRFYQFFSRGKK